MKLDRLNFYLVAAVVFLTPLLFIPILANSFDLPKGSFLLLGTLLALVLWKANAFLAQKLPVVKSIFLLPAALFAASSLISAVLTDNKIASLTSDPVVYLACFILFFVISQLVNEEKTLSKIAGFLLFSAVLLGLFTIVQNLFTGLPSLSSALDKIPYLSTGFSPAGSILSQAIFLAIVLPLALGLFLSKKSPLAALSLVFTVIGLSLSIFVLTKQNPILLPQNVGWKVATISLGRTPLSAFFGIGPGNFIDAFTVGKTTNFNSTPFWNLRFTTSSNFYFYLLTTTGLAGLGAFLVLAFKIIKMAKKRWEAGAADSLEKGLTGSLLVSLILFALLPAPQVALLAFFVILALLVGHFRIKENGSYISLPFDPSTHKPWLRPLSLVLALALFGVSAFYLGRFVLADFYFASSLRAAAANRGTETYNHQIRATALNPWDDVYHLAYSQTNLALADTLAGNPNLSDEQKQTVVALVQQAIREGRIAAALSPKRAANFENLALIYRNLINFAQGADQWALISQNQAITLDPVSPRLRLDLGAIFFTQKDYQSAGQAFAAAVTLKPDYANAHYNLAQIMKLLNLTEPAKQQLQLTATLVCAVDAKGPDCQRVNAEIKGLIPTPEATQSSNLATPSASPSNLPKAQTKPPAKVSSGSGELAQ